MKPCGRSRHRWQNNTEMDLKETGWDSCDSEQCAAGGSCKHGNDHPGSIITANFLTS